MQKIQFSKEYRNRQNIKEQIRHIIKYKYNKSGTIQLCTKYIYLQVTFFHTAVTIIFRSLIAGTRDDISVP